MSALIDKQSVRDAYNDVRSDITETDWAVFKFEDNIISHFASGVDFDELKSHLNDDERAFIFVRVQTGDEMSKRKKFVFVTFIGPLVSTLQRARMSIDKSLIKEVITSFAVELQIEKQEEANEKHFREAAQNAGGANYGTGN